LKKYPAVVVRGVDSDLLAALVDDFSPSAIEPRDTDVRVFFATAPQRDEAHRALAPRFDVAVLDVNDDDWARRSQDSLQPVQVGRLLIHPSSDRRLPELRSPGVVPLVIVPSMGFGTGHHATTRLCLEALQAIALGGRDVLDVGTGSGILAIAASLLGAARATGIDVDADAMQSARENLAANPAARVELSELDLTREPLPSADVVTANLTGALLVRSASLLAQAVRTGGILILSGILSTERDEVLAAFGHLPLTWERQEDEWVSLAFQA